MVIAGVRIPHAGVLIAGVLVVLIVAGLSLRIDAYDGGLGWGWLLFGFAAQALFTLRFLVQWWASERERRTVVPVSFWWLSLLGGVSLGVYFIRRGDPVGIVSQFVPVAIYLRNLWLIHAERRRPDEDGAASP